MTHELQVPELQNPELPNPKPQKLAIAISGAVSLGSYEAGVMYEVVRAIEHHNLNVSDPVDRIEIDVITGASAGAITACILAHKLLYEKDQLVNANDNALYNPWVKDVDIRTLLPFQRAGQPNGDDPKFSIFSSELIESLGQRYILSRYNRDGSPKSAPHPHPVIGTNGIRLGLALGNLKGFDFGTVLTDFFDRTTNWSTANVPFAYRKHQDRFTCQLPHPAPIDPRPDGSRSPATVEFPAVIPRQRRYQTLGDTLGDWQQIETAARASGAFPFAFRVQDLTRSANEEIGSNQQPVFPDRNGKYPYTDGGIFENEPLGMAKMLVNGIDTEPDDYERRYFLFVSPGGRAANYWANPKAMPFAADNATFLRTGVALLQSIFTQARFQDWITTSAINEDIREFDEQVEALRQVMLRQIDSAESTQVFTQPSIAIFESWLNQLYADNRPGAQQRDYQRLQQQFRTECEELAQRRSEDLAIAWLKLVQVLEKSGGLRNKDQMRIYAITTSNQQLLGEGLSLFSGFFSQEFRQHDYDLGRREALQFLNGLQRQSAAAHAMLHSDASSDTDKRMLYLSPQVQLSELPALNPELVRVAQENPDDALRLIDPKVRQAVKQRFVDRAQLIVDDLFQQWQAPKNGGFLAGLLRIGLIRSIVRTIVRWAIGQILNSPLNRLLKLE